MQMAVADTTDFPLVDLRAVSDSAHQWVALSVRLGAPARVPAATAPSPWQTVFDDGALLSAMVPLDCILHLPGPGVLDAALLAKLPPDRVVLAIDAAALAQDGALRQLSALQQDGYRVLIDSGAGAGVTAPPTFPAVAHDCAAALAYKTPLPALFGPHLAHAVETTALFEACSKAGFSWFSGAHALHRPAAAAAEGDDADGTTARRLLKLLGLLLADADTRDIEVQLRQDPALCYHLLRLVNSAAFAAAMPINNFAQAIDRLGRRQLLRWLQLLLYTRARADGLANPLLPVAAMRAAQIEFLCGELGGDRAAQDVAFQIGVFSLLDVLLDMPMADIVAALLLPPERAAALLERSGVLGGLLALVEGGVATGAALTAVAITPLQWWHSQLRGFHWAIQVSRNL
ncbi:HDOD domain-containing protein [Massilia sp. PWRC2]|uniref:HDOD domain-containing protein n=1 Tax=Massilia sp. PWRC2 TaxID=2804626 RepID=UPI003CF368A0